MVQTADGWFYSAASHFKESVIHPTKELCQWRSRAQSSDQESNCVHQVNLRDTWDIQEVQ